MLVEEAAVAKMTVETNALACNAATAKAAKAVDAAAAAAAAAATKATAKAEKAEATAEAADAKIDPDKIEGLDTEEHNASINMESDEFKAAQVGISMLKDSLGEGGV